MIDSHCHLVDRKFSSDLPEVLLRAEENGIEAIVTIADSLEESKACIELSEKYQQIFCSVGVHPHGSSQWSEDSDKQMRHLIQSSPKVKAVGEIGLDYHYDNSPRDVQRYVFRTQLALAKELDIPAVIHCRNAIGDLKKIINEVGHSPYVIHCCTEQWGNVESLVKAGALLGFTGIATYPSYSFRTSPKSEDIRETIKQCPLSQMMVETDAPYLAPDFYRGKRNEPAFVVEVAKVIAEIKGVPLEEVDAQITKNTVEFYRIAPASLRKASVGE